MTVSATLAINEETARRRAAGQPVLALGFGETGLPVHESLVRRLGEAAGHASYRPVAGIEDLRDAAAGYWQRRGIATTSGRVIAGPGTKPLLYALLRANRGGVALPGPSWVSYTAQAALLRIPAELLPTLPGQGGVPDPDALDAAATRCRRDGTPLTAVVLTLPDNPTGTVADPETVRATCAVADRHDLLIISDEIYRDLVHDEATAYLSPAEVAPAGTVVTTGLSKSLALGGWRTGVARFPHGPRGTRLIDEVAAIASEVWSAPAHPAQYAAAWAFTEPDLPARTGPTQPTAPQPGGARSGRPAPRRGRERAKPDRRLLRLPRPGAAPRDAPSTTRRPHRAPARDRAPRRTRDRDPARCRVGEPPAALRLRVATSLPYGSTHEQREQSVTSHDPTALPWVAQQLSTLRVGLERLLGH